MKKQLFIPLMVTLSLYGGDIVLTPEQHANWQMKVKAPQSTGTLPLGEFITKVVTPPSLLHTISLPFEANVKKLNVANYQYVQNDDVLAEVTGTEWISTQQKAISDTLEVSYHEQRVARKNTLCKEEIIPQKECTAANAELEAAKIKVLASKALLKSYGASDKMIETLFNDLQLSPTIELTSSVAGRIVELHASPGKSTNPEDALFIIQEKGSLWLESDIEALRTQGLVEGQDVTITLDNIVFKTKILQIAPVINPQNQTRQVRLHVPENVNLSSGLRSTANITLSAESYRVIKNAVIKEGEHQIVFVKTNNGFRSVPVTILTEDDSYYYLKPSDALKHEIAVSSLAVLKNMLGEDDE